MSNDVKIRKRPPSPITDKNFHRPKKDRPQYSEYDRYDRDNSSRYSSRYDNYNSRPDYNSRRNDHNRNERFNSSPSRDKPRPKPYQNSVPNKIMNKEKNQPKPLNSIKIPPHTLPNTKKNRSPPTSTTQANVSTTNKRKPGTKPNLSNIEKFYPQNRLPTGKFISAINEDKDQTEKEQKKLSDNIQPTPKLIVAKPGTTKSIFKALPPVGSSKSHVVIP